MCLSIRPGVGRLPSLTFYEFDPHWNLVAHQSHHIEGLNYAHDFLLLPDYYILHMTPFVNVSSLRFLCMCVWSIVCTYVCVCVCVYHMYCVSVYVLCVCMCVLDDCTFHTVQCGGHCIHTSINIYIYIIYIYI